MDEERNNVMKKQLYFVAGILVGVIMMIASFTVVNSRAEGGAEAGAAIIKIIAESAINKMEAEREQAKEEQKGVFGGMRKTEWNPENSAMVEDEDRWEPTQINLF